MRRKIQGKIYDFCYMLEAGISVVIAVAVIILGVKLFWDMLHSTIYDTEGSVLVDILDKAMTLAIGVEFIKMLCKHTPQTVVEVLVFAIAKQLVVFHTTPLENLLNVVAIAGLFAVRKFLIRSSDVSEKVSKKTENNDGK